MKFLIDAQLPYRLKTWLLAAGFDVIHTNDLPKQNLTEDLEIAQVADNTQRTVITKDGDFLKLKILQNKPEKLLLILLALFVRNLDTALQLFATSDVVEINNSFVIGHSFE